MPYSFSSSTNPYRYSPVYTSAMNATQTATMIEPQVDSDLCYLLGTMSLSGSRHGQEESCTPAPSTPPNDEHQDVGMFQDPQPLEDIKSTVSKSKGTEFFGCGLLEATQAHLDGYTTTGGEYLEIIFTHREIFYAFPQGHRCCARGFSDLAASLEKRAWRADRDADIEAVNAFRNEAWIIANF